MNLVEKAREFATTVHEGQYRDGKVRIPYITHPAEVAELVKAYGASEEAVCAAWLHDTVEDTETTLEDIEREFGKKVASIVAEVTDNPEHTRAQKKAAQIEHASQYSECAALIKWADKTSNVRSLKKTPPGWSVEKQREYVRLADALVYNLAYAPKTAVMKYTEATSEIV